MNTSRINIIQKHKELKRPLILDGAMGSLLQQQGIKRDENLWSSKANIQFPEKVIELHKKYIETGADIITTNTFRTNPYVYKQTYLNISNETFVKESVKLAIEARADKQIIIAGSNAPAEDCYQVERTISKEELEYNHKTHIQMLWDSGVDIIWNETFSHMDEIKIICDFCSGNKIPFVVNFFFTEDLKLLSGETLLEAVDYVLRFYPTAIGYNCISPKVFSENHFMNFNHPWGFYLNCGSGNYTDEVIECGIIPKDYVDFIKPYLRQQPLFIGSCCGSSPAHTKAIKDYFDNVSME